MLILFFLLYFIYLLYLIICFFFDRFIYFEHKLIRFFSYLLMYIIGLRNNKIIHQFFLFRLLLLLVLRLKSIIFLMTSKTSFAFYFSILFIELVWLFILSFRWRIFWLILMWYLRLWCSSLLRLEGNFLLLRLLLYLVLFLLLFLSFIFFVLYRLFFTFTINMLIILTNI